MKVLKAVPMWQAQGYRVVLYGPDEIDCEPDEHVVITTAADRKRWGFGDGFNTALTPFLWDAGQPYWFEANTRTIDAMRERVFHRDFICLITSTQQSVADAVSGHAWNNPIVVEWAIGYEGVYGPFAAFESYAWMHHVYGLRGWRNGRAFDAVIPNFFDPEQFPPVANPSGDYLLYMGRLIQRKGPHIAAEIAKHVGLPLKVAGPGATEWGEGRIVAPEIVLEGDIEYVGEVRFADRAELMGNAAAVLVPTLYVEPFGGVAVEAMLAGTPAVASDWGAFTETITPELGRRFHTLRQGITATQEAMTLDRERIREVACERYSLDAVGPMFKDWFETLETLWGQGWYELQPTLALA